MSAGGVLLGLVGHHLGAVLELVQPLASFDDGHLGLGDLALRVDAFGLERCHARAGEVLGDAGARFPGALAEELLTINGLGASAEEAFQEA